MECEQEDQENNQNYEHQQQQQEIYPKQESIDRQEEPLVEKEFQIEFVLKQLYNPLALQAIYGDVFIDLNYDYANSQQFGQPSLLNQYKQVISVEFFEEMGLVEVNLNSNYQPIYDFQPLSKALCCHSEQHLRELGERLMKYQTIASVMKQRNMMIKQLINHSDLVETLAVSYAEFEGEARKLLVELQKTNKLYIYSIRQINPNNFGFELKKYGYSADFLKLLGYNIDQYTNLSIRKGLIELQNFQGRIALNKMALDLLLGEIVSSVTIKTSYITSDDLELQVDGIVKQVFNTPHQFNHHPFFKHSEFLAIVVLDVQTDAMKQIYSIRQSNKMAAAAAAAAAASAVAEHFSPRDMSDATSPRTKEKNHKYKDSQQTSVFGGPAIMNFLPNNKQIDVDEYYLMETQILLEKFYEKYSTKRKVKRKKKNLVLQEQNQVMQILQTNKHILTSKTCGYRFINQLTPK